MPHADDVATCIIAQLGSMTSMKLQKLLYYCQAWSLVWDEAPLYEEEIQAWTHGPVVPAVYKKHRGMFMLEDWPHGDANIFNGDQVDTIESVLQYYGDKSSQWLIELTHREAPWGDARGTLGRTERCSEEITHASMAEYYSSLLG